MEPAALVFAVLAATSVATSIPSIRPVVVRLPDRLTAAALTVPVAGASWAILAGLTNEDGQWLSITVLLAASIASYLFISPTYSIPLMLFVFSLWLHRMTYILAQKLLIAIIEDSYDAYDMLAENVEIQDAMIPASIE